MNNALKNEPKRASEKRKISLKYIIWMVALFILFVIFFCILIFQLRLFERFKKAEVISHSSDNNNYKITFLIDGIEYTSNHRIYSSIGGKLYSVSDGDFIEYQVSDPKCIFINRNELLIPLIVFDSLFLVGMIPLTIYEIKKGFVA